MCVPSALVSPTRLKIFTPYKEGDAPCPGASGASAHSNVPVSVGAASLFRPCPCPPKRQRSPAPLVCPFLSLTTQSPACRGAPHAATATRLYCTPAEGHATPTPFLPFPFLHAVLQHSCVDFISSSICDFSSFLPSKSVLFFVFMRERTYISSLFPCRPAFLPFVSLFFLFCSPFSG